jgi:arylsulfatase A-like enzyme
MTENSKRRRNILLITTDQMRYDSLRCNGGKVARTPVADKLAAEGINDANLPDQRSPLLKVEAPT